MHACVTRSEVSRFLRAPGTRTSTSTTRGAHTFHTVQEQCPVPRQEHAAEHTLASTRTRRRPSQIWLLVKYSRPGVSSPHAQEHHASTRVFMHAVECAPPTNAQTQFISNASATPNAIAAPNSHYSAGGGALFQVFKPPARPPEFNNSLGESTLHENFYFFVRRCHPLGKEKILHSA